MVAKKKAVKKSAKKSTKKVTVKRAAKKVSAKKTVKSVKKPAAKKSSAKKEVAVQPVTDSTGVVTLKSVDEQTTSSDPAPAKVKPSLDEGGALIMVPESN